MSTRLLMALGAGLASALAAINFAGGISPLPLFLVGLGLGTAEIIAAMTMGIAAVGVSEGPFAAGRFAIFYAVPTFVLSRGALFQRTDAAVNVRWLPNGDLVGWLTGFGLVFLILGWFADWTYGGAILNRIGQFLDNWFQAAIPDLAPDERRTFVGSIVPWLPGTMATMWVLATALNAAAAQAILVRMGRNKRPVEPWADLTLPDWTSWVLVTAAAIALGAPDEFKALGRNVALVASVPFLMLGFAVAATLLSNFRGPGKSRGWLMAGIFSLSLVFTWVLFAIAALGMAEQWAGIRRRIANGASGTGNRGSE